MKTAIYIEDGVVQLVLTPEGEFEKNALSTMMEKPLSVEIKEGSFYKSVGGYMRHAQNSQDRSIFLIVQAPEHARHIIELHNKTLDSEPQT